MFTNMSYSVIVHATWDTGSTVQHTRTVGVDEVEKWGILALACTSCGCRLGSLALALGLAWGGGDLIFGGGHWTQP